MATSPDVEARAAALRAGGWSVAAIAAELQLSGSTVKRICKKHQVRRGEVQQELIEAARGELLLAAADDARIKAALGGFLLDTLAHISTSRDKALASLEQLDPSSTKDASVVMRALAAHSVALKNHTDTLRRLLPEPGANDEVPELVVYTLTPAEVDQMREEQVLEALAISGASHSAEPLMDPD